jgi:hypothetical protein
VVLRLDELVKLLGQLRLLDATERGEGESVLGNGLVVIVLAAGRLGSADPEDEVVSVFVDVAVVAGGIVGGDTHNEDMFADVEG